MDVAAIATVTFTLVLDVIRNFNADRSGPLCVIRPEHKGGRPPMFTPGATVGDQEDRRPIRL
jgi:hypothetical protein